MILMSLFECLTGQDPKDLHPIPAAAERWEISADQLTYTFFIRKNAKWSNGENVTAHDFYRSYRRMLEPSLAAQYAYMHHVVKGAQDYNEGKLKDLMVAPIDPRDTFVDEKKYRLPMVLSEELLDLTERQREQRTLKRRALLNEMYEM